MSENPLINIGELSKPATVLVEKISDAIGGLFKPNQIVRIAKAEAEARKIEAENRIEITDLERRAFSRFMKEEARKQKNIEEITKKALPLLNEDAQPDKVEEDWIANFFDKSRLVSDQEMQLLWSRILASEANSPGTHSKRTITLLASLDKSDAELFVNLCNFSCKIHNLYFAPIIFDHTNQMYTKNNINFNTLTHLEDIGLINFESAFGFAEDDLPNTFSIQYHGKKIDLEKGNKEAFSIGEVLFTKTGGEIARICSTYPVEGFHEFLLQELIKNKNLKN